MALTERGHWANNAITDRGKRAIATILFETGYFIFPYSDTSPPLITINSVSRYKISDEAGFNQCILKFQCSEAIQAWEVRQNGLGVGQGTLLENGGSVAANTEITAYIDWNEISGGDGQKEINIYAQDNAGNWTPYHQA